MSEKKPWPFDQPPDCAVISVRDIVFGGTPILYVSHDEDDRAWQFLTGQETRKEDAVVVGLKEVVQLDASVVKLADLPPGWIATRQNATANWDRRPRT